MNDSGFRYKSPAYIIGKEFIIVIVVFSSALSFTLGYFVGKSVPDNNTSTESRQNALTPLPREQVAQPDHTGRLEKSQPDDSGYTDKSGAENEQIPHRKDTLTEKAKAPSPSGKTLKKGKSSIVKTTKQKGHEIIYTVQLAAFRNAVEADHFREKYIKKGYDTYITISKNKNDDNIYQIRAGQFSKRRDAEILALKIKKTEGLNPYVTFGND